jgi:hypothetical protein
LCLFCAYFEIHRYLAEFNPLEFFGVKRVEGYFFLSACSAPGKEVLLSHSYY